MKRRMVPPTRKLVLLTALALAGAAQAQTVLTVTNTADGGAGSLRQALTTIAADTGCTAPMPYNVNFAIPGAGIQVITLGTAPLPQVFCPTVIDGFTQPGASLGPTASASVIRVEVDGTNVVAAASPPNGFSISSFGAQASVVRGLSIVNFLGSGIALGGFSGRVEGNWIGLRADGVTPGPNNHGVNVTGSSTTVGGANGGNLIAHNAGSGVNVSFANASNLVVSGNDIFGNGLLGLDVQNSGVPLANGPQNFVLPNQGQNYPLITSATYTGTQTTLAGTVNVFFNANHSLEFFTNSLTFGLDEGQGFAGSTTLTTPAPGVYPFTVTLPSIVRNPTATATGPAGTSEFSGSLSPFPTPEAALSTNVVNFPATNVGATSAVVPLTLTNTGPGTMRINAITLTASPPFQDTNAVPANLFCGLGPAGNGTGGAVTPPLTLAPNATCTLNLVFSPTAAGAATGTATFLTGNTVPGGDPIATLNGNGVALPAIQVTPTLVTFAGQTVGSTSAPQTVTVTSTGSLPLSITGIASLGNFAQTTNCPLAPATLAPATSCQIQATFTPLVTGLQTGSLTVTSNASATPTTTVALEGTGLAPPIPTITAPVTVPFPPTQVGSASSPINVTLGNSGAAPLTISLVELVGTGFTLLTNGCTAPISLGGACTLTLSFNPGVAGDTAASLRVFSNAPTSPTYITLTGTGTAAPIGTLTAPAALGFGVQVVGTTSSPQAVAITNAGGASVNVASVTASGDFSQVNNCTLLLPGTSCTANVVFAPTAAGTRSGTLQVASDASNALLTVGLAGTGAPVAVPVIELSASSLAFGNRITGAGGTSQSITLRNAGGAGLALGAFTVTGDFGQSNNCPAVVAPGGSCRIDVSFLASLPGARTGQLSVASNAASGSGVAQLAGTGCRTFSLTRGRLGGLTCR